MPPATSVQTAAPLEEMEDLQEPAIPAELLLVADLESEGTDRALSQVQGGAFQLPPGNPTGLGIQATPIFFRTMPSPKTTVTSPYKNFFEIDSKEQKTLWREMVKPSNDHVLLDMTITNSKAIDDLFQDKAITYHWMHFMCIPTAGTGVISPDSKCSPGGKDIFNTDLSNFKNPIENFNHITRAQVMAFASWFMGDNCQSRAICPSYNMKMKYLDVKAPGNPGLVACFKQECCNVYCLVWHTIKYHLTVTSYKALLVCKKEFAYKCDKTGDISYK
jgi:hypothetical protein